MTSFGGMTHMSTSERCVELLTGMINASTGLAPQECLLASRAVAVRPVAMCALVLQCCLGVTAEALV